MNLKYIPLFYYGMAILFFGISTVFLLTVKIQDEIIIVPAVLSGLGVYSLYRAFAVQRQIERLNENEH